MDAAIKYPPSTPMNFETDAAAVKYDDGTLETPLNYLNNLGFSTFGKKLLASDEAEFKRLLKISSEDIWDEKQNRWNLNTAALSTAQKKFGTQSLRVTSSTMSNSVSPLYFGGDPFTISCWVYPVSPDSGQFIFRALGSSSSFGIGYISTNNCHLYTGTTAASTKVGAQFGMAAGSWKHLEVCYNSGTVYVFFGGVAISPISFTVGRAVRRIWFGPFDGYIDEFRILDGTCAHTAAFTPPTTAYSVGSTTLSLLHFE